MKKALSLIIALVLVATMGLTAFAADTYSITIENSETDHTYEAYQIFTGDIVVNADKPSESTLSNINWGSGIDSAKLLAMPAYASYSTAADTADAVATALKEGKIDAETFAKDVESCLTTTVADTDSYSDDNAYVLSGLAAGYYLVKDQDGSQDNAEEDAYTAYIMSVVADITAKPKTSTPTVQKKVKDINDSTDTALTDWQDSADHDIGDTVNFQLKATLGDAGMEYFDTYSVTFHDTMSKGLTYVNVTSVTVGSKTLVDTDYTVTTAPATDDSGDTIITITVKDVKAHGATNGSVITVEYTATLNENANIGAAGNPNEVYLEYSNNPNQSDATGDGKDDTTGEDIETGYTPEDKVIVFTYQTVINKVKEDGTALTGAEFKLEKYDADAADNKWITVAEVDDDDLDTFTFKGIDDGIYRLTETKTPAGYNSIDPIYFEVTASHDTESQDPKLTALSATQCNEDGSVLATGVVATFTATATPADGSITSNIVNKSGTTLPSTGGIGTTIFYVVGGLLMIVAVVVLVAKKRVSAED